MEDNTKTQGNPKKKVLANILLIVTTLLRGTFLDKIQQDLPIEWFKYLLKNKEI